MHPKPTKSIKCLLSGVKCVLLSRLWSMNWPTVFMLHNCPHLARMCYLTKKGFVCVSHFKPNFAHSMSQWSLLRAEKKVKAFNRCLAIQYMSVVADLRNEGGMFTIPHSTVLKKFCGLFKVFFFLEKHLKWYLRLSSNQYTTKPGRTKSLRHFLPLWGHEKCLTHFYSVVDTALMLLDDKCCLMHFTKTMPWKHF